MSIAPQENGIELNQIKYSHDEKKEVAEKLDDKNTKCQELYAKV